MNKKYMCSCGQVYYSDHGTPMGISWTDGHTCEPEESKRQCIFILMTKTRKAIRVIISESTNVVNIRNEKVKRLDLIK